METAVRDRQVGYTFPTPACPRRLLIAGYRSDNVFLTAVISARAEVLIVEKIRTWGLLFGYRNIIGLVSFL